MVVRKNVCLVKAKKAKTDVGGNSTGSTVGSLRTAPGAAPLLLTSRAPLKPAQAGLNLVPISAPFLGTDVALLRNLLFLPLLTLFSRTLL